MTGRWVRRTPEPPPPGPHTCEPPTRVSGELLGHIPVPEGHPGDVWRCECGRLWQVTVAGWKHANWRQRFWYSTDGWTYKTTPSGRSGAVSQRKAEADLWRKELRDTKGAVGGPKGAPPGSPSTPDYDG